MGCGLPGMMSTLNDILYPPVEPYNSSFLDVSPLHSIYYEECGNKAGLPVVFLHGGPGSGSSNNPQARRFFDPNAYRIILFDQRGAGKSTPAFSLEENDTWSLVADMEKLREHLGIEKWVLFGGSWGSTLALVYAEKHTDRVLALVLRGIFTLRKEEIDWIYKGAPYLFPDYWEEFLSPIPQDERAFPFEAYYKRLNGDNHQECVRYARFWTKWETVASQFSRNPEDLAACSSPEIDSANLYKARLEFHYFLHNGFLPSPNYILDHAHIIHNKEIPVTIVQGRYDCVCPPKTAWNLYQKLPNADFYIVEGAAHSTKTVGIAQKLVEACDKYKVLLQN